MTGQINAAAGPVLVILGCGDLGARLGLQLVEDGWRVHGLRRNAAALPAGLHPLAGDLGNPVCPAGWPEGDIDYLVYAAAADSREPQAYRRAYVEGLQHALGWLRVGQRPRRLLFVSSTAVYGQADGRWIDETSPTEPASFSGQILLEAERVARESGIPATAVRLSGLYGPGRGALLRQVQAGRRAPDGPPQYGNRIHIEDAAGLLAHLLEADRQGERLEDCYLGVDDAPAALAEVVAWLRERLAVTAEDPTPLARGAGSKRCSNARARALGWQPRFPSYREGYAALLEGFTR